MSSYITNNQNSYYKQNLGTPEKRPVTRIYRETLCHKMTKYGHINSLEISYVNVFNSVVETDGINYLQILLEEMKCKLVISKTGKIDNK